METAIILAILLIGNLLAILAHLAASEISYQHSERNLALSFAGFGFAVGSLLFLFLSPGSLPLLSGILAGIAILGIVLFLLGPMLAGSGEA